MTWRGVVAAVLALVALPGCAGLAAGDPPGIVRQIEAEPRLADVSRQLAGGIPEDPADMRRLLETMTTSVRDMSRLDAAAYEARYERAAADQAALVGEWLGLASTEVRGRLADAELADAAQSVPGGPSPAPGGGGGLSVAKDVAARLASLAPNEPTDNPGLPGAESLRSTLQSAFAGAAG